MTLRGFLVCCGCLTAVPALAGSQPVRTREGMVVAQEARAARIGADVLRDGGGAVDAAVATALALAVTHPAAGNIGGGGFLLYRPASGAPLSYDFREMAPAGATATMFLRNGKYDEERHHESHLAVGVPGTVAGLHLAWKEQGRLPWRRLIEPAIALARDGFVVTDGLARSLKDVLPKMKKYRASLAQFSRDGSPYAMGEVLKQPDLALTLERIAARGPAGFYEGETAELIDKEMAANGGLVTRADLGAYQVRRREPLRGTYRGYDVLSMAPVSSGGTALIEMLNVLEGYDLARSGYGSAATVHLMAEAMRRAFADRARYLGDPEANPQMPIQRLLSKEYAAGLRRTIRQDRASVSSPETFEWPAESAETTHISVVDKERNAVALTYTLEDSYGSKIVVPGAGFLLNNEMGDFNAGPGLTDKEGLIGTEPNLAAPGKRMLSSMTPTIVAREGTLFMVVGTPGGRTIINTVLQALLNVIDFGMNVQEAIDAPRLHHQWLPDRIQHERFGLSPDTLALLRERGHTLFEAPFNQGAAQGIVFNAKEGVLEGGYDRRSSDSAAIAAGPAGALEAARPEVERLIQASGAEVAVAARTLDGGDTLLIRPDDVFHAASTMKVPVMIALFAQAGQGRLRLDDPLPVRNQFASIVDGSPYALDPAEDSDQDVYRAVGSSLTLRQLCEAMITVSSNLATNLLIEKLGVENIRRRVQALGAEGMNVLRGVEDGKAFRAGLVNTTTARGLLVLLEAIASGKAAGPGATGEMVDILKRQKLNGAIPAGLPPGTAVAHKTGTITRIHHDAGIVYGPRPYVLAVLVRGIQEEKESAALIAGITRTVNAAIAGTR
jgi:gamma-glutamyltranspeptidase / glutathione hydrolase